MIVLGRHRPLTDDVWDETVVRAVIDEIAADAVARSNDPVWLERARQFAMTAIVQYRGARQAAGRGRYSLWTGDIGFAVYLWDCITAEPRFPPIDVF